MRLIARIGPGADEALVWYEGVGTADRRWLIADQLGSIVAVTNGAGAAMYINSYDEYGAPGPSNSGRFQYTGQAWLPEAQLYHYKARAYLPALGRFAQTDPIGFGGGINLYAYVGNDPVNWTDPSGLTSCPPVDPEGETCVEGRRPQPPAVTGGFGFSYVRWQQELEDAQYLEEFCRRADSLAANLCPGEEEEEIVVTAERCMTYACQRARLDRWKRENRGLGGRLFLEGFGFLVTEGALTAATGGLSALRFLRFCGCFVEGAEVATPDGLVAIEHIAVGDEVLAWNPETGETTTQTVTALIRPGPKLIWRLEARDAGGETEVFEVTDDHPWYVEGDGWVETRNLRPGQRIETADDSGLTILDIARTDRVERTYNLTVDGPHTFLVGEDGAVVHNIKCGPAAERLARSIARQIRRDLGPAARRVFHDMKVPGAGDRTAAELYQDALELYRQYGIDPPSWFRGP